MRLLPIILIVFLIVFPTWGADNEPPLCHLTDAELDKKLGVDEKTKVPAEYVWVIYFHQVPVCETCQLMTNLIYETLSERFADEVQGKQLVLRYRNFESEQNAALVKKLGIKSPSLVVSQIKSGKMVKAKLPGKIWTLVAEKEEFIDYTAREIQAYFPECEGKQQ